VLPSRFALGITWEENANIHQKLYLAKQTFMHPFFMDIFMVGAWCRLSNERNDLISIGEFLVLQLGRLISRKKLLLILLGSNQAFISLFCFGFGPCNF
jgi:hypothetical protein